MAEHGAAAAPPPSPPRHPLHRHQHHHHDDNDNNNSSSSPGASSSSSGTDAASAATVTTTTTTELKPAAIAAHSAAKPTASAGAAAAAAAGSSAPAAASLPHHLFPRAAPADGGPTATTTTTTTTSSPNASEPPQESAGGPVTDVVEASRPNSNAPPAVVVLHPSKSDSFMKSSAAADVSSAVPMFEAAATAARAADVMDAIAVAKAADATTPAAAVAAAAARSDPKTQSDQPLLSPLPSVPPTAMRSSAFSSSSAWSEPRSIESSDPYHSLLLDLLSLSGDLHKPIFPAPLLLNPAASASTQRSSSSPGPDVESILSRLSSLVSKHIPSSAPPPLRQLSPYATPKPPSAKPLVSPSPELQSLLLMSQVAAVISHPLLVLEHYRTALEAEVEAIVCDWFKRVFGVWTLKHVHYHGSVDYSGGRLPFSEIQVYRTATFQSMQASHADRLSASIPVFYFPATDDAEIYERTVLNSWNLIGGPLHIQSVKLRRIPLLSLQGDIIDTVALLSLFNEDVAMGRRPCLVVARAGTPVSGQCDPIDRCRELCSKFNCWLHVIGENLSLLMSSSHQPPPSPQAPLPKSADAESSGTPLESSSSLQQTPASVLAAARSADSFTVDLGAWLGLADDALCPVTVFVNVDPRRADALVAGVGSASLSSSAGVGGLLQTGLRSPARSASGPVGSLVKSSNGTLAGSSLSIAPFQTSGVSVGGAWRPTPLRFSLPWWLLAGDLDAEGGMGWHFVRARELARTLAKRAMHVRTLHCPSPTDLTYLTCCVRFSPTSVTAGSGGSGLLSSLERFAEVGSPPPISLGSARPQTPIVASPSSPRLGPSERVMQTRYREIADLGTKRLFELVPEDVKSDLGLGLVSLGGYLYIRYRPGAISTSIDTQSNQLLSLTRLLTTRSECVDSALRLQPAFAEIVRDFNARSSASTPVSSSAPPAVPTGLGPELRVIELALVVPPVGRGSLSGPSTSPSSQSLPTSPHPSTPVGTFFHNHHSTTPISSGVYPASATSTSPQGGVLAPWLGPGVVQYCPAYIDPEAPDLADSLAIQLDALNVAIVDRLSNSSSRFSGDVFSPGIVRGGGPRKVKRCVRIGLDTMPYTEDRIRELLEAVVRCGRDLEKEEAFVDAVSAVIRKGIRQAEEELRGDMSDELSLLRTLPIIGTVLGVLGVPAPKPKPEVTYPQQQPQRLGSAGDSASVGGAMDGSALLTPAALDPSSGGGGNVAALGHFSRSAAAGGTASGAATTATGAAAAAAGPTITNGIVDAVPASPRTSMSSNASAGGGGGGWHQPHSFKAAGVAHAFTLSGGLASIPILPHPPPPGGGIGSRAPSFTIVRSTGNGGGGLGLPPVPGVVGISGPLEALLEEKEREDDKPAAGRTGK